uniref:Uncharacterized protein n=1 Tax=Rhizophora mucronata TaxID=61149 RepID=A0A2P2PPG7_RHIMU
MVSFEVFKVLWLLNSSSYWGNHPMGYICFLYSMLTIY